MKDWKQWVVGKSLWKSLRRGAILALVAFVVCKFVLIPVKVKGPGMEPTFANGSLHWVYAHAYRSTPPAVDDIVAISLSGKSLMYVSRIYATPGDSVEIKANALWVNDKKVADGIDRTGYPKVTLSETEFFILGDGHSSEGRGWLSPIVGRVERDRIVGEVIF